MKGNQNFKNEKDDLGLSKTESDAILDFQFLS